jgi:hypothetical protein
MTGTSRSLNGSQPRAATPDDPTCLISSTLPPFVHHTLSSLFFISGQPSDLCPSAILGSISSRRQDFESTFLVSAHQAAIACDIGRKNCCQPSLDPGLTHGKTFLSSVRIGRVYGWVAGRVHQHRLPGADLRNLTADSFLAYSSVS